MTPAEVHVPLPTADEKETQYVAASGAVVTFRLMDTDRWEVKLDTRGDYTAVLSRRADGTFDLQPAPGVNALAQTAVPEAELYERF